MADTNKYYDCVSVTVPANAQGETLAFVSTTEEPRTLLSIAITTGTANVNVTVYDERERICNINSNSAPLTDKWLEINRVIKAGHACTIGLVNGTGSSVTMVISYMWQLTGV